MLEEREFEGYWWLPSDPETRLPGTLKFSQKDVELELLGSFEPHLVPGPLTGPEDQPRILGVTKAQKAITLEQSLGAGRTLGSGGFPITRYRPHQVLHGAWYDPGEEVVFDQVAIRLSDLDTWAAKSGFEIEWTPDDENKSFSKLSVTYTPLEPVTVNLDTDTTLSVEFGWTWSGMRVPQTENHIVQKASFVVRFARPASTDKVLDYVYYLRNFLSVGVGRPIQVLGVTGYHNSPRGEEPDPVTKQEPRPLDVEILYRLVGVPEAPERELHISELLFTLGDALPRLEEIIQAWFARQEVLREVFARYFYIVHGPAPDRDHAFESYVRILETHHRRTAAETEASEETRARVDRLLSEVEDSSDREWLEQELAHSHEPSLSQRLHQTLARCSRVSARAVGSRKKRDSFVWKVVKTRNYKTHLDPLQKDGAADGLALVALVFQLKALVEMTLLLELGFTCEQVDEILERTRRYELIENINSQIERAA